MGRDQQENSRNSAANASPRAMRKARAGSASATGGGSSVPRKSRETPSQRESVVARSKREARASTNDWQTPEEGSGRIRKLALVAGGVVAVVALGMTWQSTVDPEPTTAAEHSALGGGGASDDSAGDQRTTTESSTVSPTTTSTPTNLQEIWKSRIGELDSQRIAAFENKDESALAQVNVPGSPAHAHDVKLLAALQNRQVKPVSLATNIHSATLISGDNESALVEVMDSRSEYVVTTESMNKTIKRFKAKQAKWRVSLRNSDGSWRYYSVAPVSS